MQRLKRLTNKSLVLLRYIRMRAKQVSIFGLGDVPIFYVITFFAKGVTEGSVSTRASAVAFNFFVAVFPTIIFVFTLIPFVPIPDFQQQLLSLIEGIMPVNAFAMIETTLIDVVTRKSGGLLSFGFLAAVIFSHNGISSLMDAFNATYHTFQIRSFFNHHLVAMMLTFILPLLLILAIAIMLFGQTTLNFLVTRNILEVAFTYYLLMIGKWIVIIALLFFSISFLYYLAPTKRTEFKFLSAGATMATVMIIVTSLAFSYFVNNFSQYNRLYGSIGSLLALLFWMYFNAIGLIIGFELNVSIAIAKKNSILNSKVDTNGQAEEYSTD